MVALVRCMVALGDGMVAPEGACVVAPEGACVVAPGGACMVAPGGMRGCSGGVCVGYDKIWRYDQ